MVFAPLVLITHAIGLSTPGTVLVAQVYLVARLVLYGVYAADIPVRRTLASLAGFGATLVLAFALRGHIAGKRDCPTTGWPIPCRAAGFARSGCVRRTMRRALHRPSTPSPMHPERSLASSLGVPPPRKPTPKDSLGCLAGRLRRDQMLPADGITVFRKTSETTAPQRVETQPSGRGVLVGISLRGGHSRRIFHEHHSSSHDFARGAIYIRDFSDRYCAELASAFDFVLLEISRAVLERAFDDRPGRRAAILARVAGTNDEVLGHFAWALTPALEQPDAASRLHVDQLCGAIVEHLVAHHADSAASPAPPHKRKRLSPLQEARAKEMLRASQGGNVAVGEIADACQLSRHFFLQAFCETTGQTPLQWLTAQQMAPARSA